MSIMVLFWLISFRQKVLENLELKVISEGSKVCLYYNNHFLCERFFPGSTGVQTQEWHSPYWRNKEGVALQVPATVTSQKGRHDGIRTDSIWAIDKHERKASQNQRKHPTTNELHASVQFRHQFEPAIYWNLHKIPCEETQNTSKSEFTFVKVWCSC